MSMKPTEDEGFFGWIYKHREKLLVDYFIKSLFAFAITTGYLAIAITIYDISFKWLVEVTPNLEFAWKTFFFTVSALAFAFGITIVVWAISIAYYLKFFKWFRLRMEFIDPERTLDD